MRVELLQAGGDVSALLAPVDAGHEEVDEPREAVLVNGLDVGQVGDAEEQDLAGVRDGRVASTDLPPRSGGFRTRKNTSSMPCLTIYGGEGTLIGIKYDACQSRPRETTLLLPDWLVRVLGVQKHLSVKFRQTGLCSPSRYTVGTRCHRSARRSAGTPGHRCAVFRSSTSYKDKSTPRRITVSLLPC